MGASSPRDALTRIGECRPAAAGPAPLLPLQLQLPPRGINPCAHARLRPHPHSILCKKDANECQECTPGYYFDSPRGRCISCQASGLADCRACEQDRKSGAVTCTHCALADGGACEPPLCCCGYPCRGQDSQCGCSALRPAASPLPLAERLTHPTCTDRPQMEPACRPGAVCAARWRAASAAAATRPCASRAARAGAWTTPAAPASAAARAASPAGLHPTTATPASTARGGCATAAACASAWPSSERLPPPWPRHALAHAPPTTPTPYLLCAP